MPVNTNPESIEVSIEKLRKVTENFQKTLLELDERLKKSQQHLDCVATQQKEMENETKENRLCLAGLYAILLIGIAIGAFSLPLSTQQSTVVCFIVACVMVLGIALAPYRSRRGD